MLLLIDTAVEIKYRLSIIQPTLSLYLPVTFHPPLPGAVQPVCVPPASDPVCGGNWGSA